MIPLIPNSFSLHNSPILTLYITVAYPPIELLVIVVLLLIQLLILVANIVVINWSVRPLIRWFLNTLDNLSLGVLKFRRILHILRPTSIMKAIALVIRVFIV